MIPQEETSIQINSSALTRREREKFRCNHRFHGFLCNSNNFLLLIFLPSRLAVFGHYYRLIEFPNTAASRDGTVQQRNRWVYSPCGCIEGQIADACLWWTPRLIYSLGKWMQRILHERYLHNSRCVVKNSSLGCYIAPQARISVEIADQIVRWRWRMKPTHSLCTATIRKLSCHATMQRMIWNIFPYELNYMPSFPLLLFAQLPRLLVRLLRSSSDPVNI